MKTILRIMTVLALTFVTWGCSKWLVADRGIADRGQVHGPQTRAEVRNLFGRADETGICDGRVVERLWIRQKIEWFPPECDSNIATQMACAGLAGAYEGSFGLIDIFVLPVVLVRSERAKLHYAFVYDETDRVLYRFDLAAPAQRRFTDVMTDLRWALYAQLKEGKCDAWTACLTEYAREARQRATCVGYTLGAEDQQRLEHIVAIGEAADARQTSFEEGLTRFSFWTEREWPWLPETNDGTVKSSEEMPPYEINTLIDPRGKRDSPNETSE